jgi:outer membrane protein
METHDNNEELTPIEKNPIENTQPTKSQSTQMVINVVLFLGIALCLILIFFKPANKSSSSKSSSSEHLRIAYVNSDSLMSQYTLFNELRDELEAETIRLREDLDKREKSIQGQFASYQKKAQSGNISYDDARKTEESLGRQQQEYMELAEKYTNDIAVKEYEMSVRVFDSLNSVLLFVNEAEHYDYILGYTQGSGILYANPALDITGQVVGIMNERHMNGKEQKNVNNEDKTKQEE